MKILKALFLITITSVLFTSCQKEESIDTFEKQEERILPLHPTDNENGKYPVTSINDLQGKWKLTHIWSWESGWYESDYTSLDFYENTFYYYANTWDVLESTNSLFATTSGGAEIGYGSKNIKPKNSNTIVVGNWKYYMSMYWNGNAMMLKNKKGDTYHWWVKQ